MGWLLKRWGYVKLSDYGMCLTPLGTVEPIVAEPISAPKPVAVAPEPVVEEDDWEWHIAIARARAAAEEVEAAVIELDRPKAIPLETPKRKPSNTRPMPVVSKPVVTPPKVTDKTVPYAENPFHTWEGPDSRTPRSLAKTVTRRVAKGTGPRAVPDETVRTMAVPEADQDATRPGMLLPSVTKRAAAR